MRKFLLALALLAPIGCQGCVSYNMLDAVKKEPVAEKAALVALPVTLTLDFVFLPVEYLWLMTRGF